jgi:predicted nucleic acid-binding protein
MVAFFLDTGFILALELSDDQYYTTAIRYWQSLSRDSTRFITMNRFNLHKALTFDHHFVQAGYQKVS